MSNDSFLAFYVGLLVVLSLIALHRLLLAFAARKKRILPVRETKRWPSVLVQLPLYNEKSVAQRIVDAACRLRYPANLLKIQVLDDSTDATPQIVSAAVARWKAQGVDVEHVQRTNRTAFKAGALSYGLTLTDHELVAVFDADFLPSEDFLEQLVGEFDDDKVGMVQARWEHLNRHESILTETQAILLDAHFVNEHGGRFAKGHFFNFNGTAGIWRRACITDAGGWSGATLTEDLDLSYRAQLKGWRFIYRPDVVVPAELPADMSAFKTQQHRWAKGSIETARLLLPRIWRSQTISFSKRVEASLHLGGNFAYPLVLVLALMLPFSINARMGNQPWFVMVLDGLFLLGSTGSLVLFYCLAERRIAAPWRSLWHLPMVLAVGIGLAVNNSRAVLEAVCSKKSDFARTPKRGSSMRDRFDLSDLPKAPWQAFVEFAFGFYLVGAVIAAATTGRYLAIPFLTLFAGGFLLMGFGSIRRPLWEATQRALTAIPWPKRI